MEKELVKNFKSNNYYSFVINYKNDVKSYYKLKKVIIIFIKKKVKYKKIKKSKLSLINLFNNLYI